MNGLNDIQLFSHIKHNMQYQPGLSFTKNFNSEFFKNLLKFEDSSHVFHQYLYIASSSSSTFHPPIYNHSCVKHHLTFPFPRFLFLHRWSCFPFTAAVSLSLYLIPYFHGYCFSELTNYILPHLVATLHIRLSTLLLVRSGTLVLFLCCLLRASYTNSKEEYQNTSRNKLALLFIFQLHIFLESSIVFHFPFHRASKYTA